MRHLAAAVLAVLLAAPVAEAGRTLTKVEAAEIKLLLLRAQAGRPTRADRQQAAARTKKQIRAAKMRAALRIGAEYKAEKARKKAEREEARKREAEKKNAARLRYLEELIRTRR